MVPRGALGLIGIAVLVAACTSSVPTALVALKTQPPGGLCMLALIAGPLVADPTSGVALGSPGGSHAELIWPPGWSDRLDGAVIAVVDDHGNVVAHVGDTVSMGGGGPNPWYVCGAVGSVKVLPSPTASGT